MYLMCERFSGRSVELTGAKLGISETSAQLGATDYAACARAPVVESTWWDLEFFERLQEAAKKFMDLKFAPGLN
jgi:hypothetical protein